MDLTVTKQNRDENKFEVDVVDNEKNEHTVGVKGSEIIYHNSEDYPDDPKDRSPEQNERVGQARWFTRYWIYCVLEHHTLENKNNPVYIDSIRRNLNLQEISQLEDDIRPLYNQLRYDSGKDGGKKVIPIPDENNYAYNIDVKFVGQKLEQERVLKQMFEEHNLDISEDYESHDLEPSEIIEWTEEPGDQEDIDSNMEHGFEVDNMKFSQVYASVYKRGEMTALSQEKSFDRKFATIEIPFLRSNSLEEFRSQIQYNLRCQIRDIFVRMGVIPPYGYEVLGQGKYSATLAYENIDFYPEVHKMNRNTVREIEEDDSDGGILSGIKSIFS